MRKPLAVTITLAATLLAAGCASQQAATVVDGPQYDGWRGSKQPEQVRPDIYPDGAVPSAEPVIREGRYRIVSTRPSAEQKDLLAQIIRYENKGGINVTVKTAMDYVTARSGYSLCSATTHTHVNTLYSLPLPDAHHNLGPMTLRNALQVLAGPAYSVEVDELTRGICFKVRDDYNLPVPLSLTKSTAPAVE
ncbi:MAG: hypothetical protein ACOX0Y_03040 [Thiopseudomonas sp.]